MYKVLIVDDDRLARQGIISMMPWEKYGMVVAGEAQNGEKALEFLQKTPVDLLFVDLSMPVMDGISLMEKSHIINPNLLFVVLTFHEDFHYVQAALRIGAIDYISKLEMESTNCDELLKRISEKVENIMLRRNINFNYKENILKPSSNTIPPKNNFDENKWQYLVKKWNEMYWIYDDDIFEELIYRTKEINVSIWRVAQVLLHLTSEAEKNIVSIKKNIPEYENIDDFFKWLISFRESLYKKASKETNLDKIQLCILKAVIYIKENLKSSLSTEKTAQIINLSRSYFSINFKKYTGMSFKEFIRRERIRYAKTLLVKKDALVSDIAHDIGYEDVNYFIRVFYELTGTTPGEYKKQLYH
ncbi:two-component system, response regulator YesN [Clostridium sp. USBA 49]|uniref:response regulator transcription factor n=1 Tax=Clostridium TaxID=1485 RepID=UPI0009C9D4AE|nr:MULTISPECIES: response regulator [Clostridium]SKA78268.1 two-component system, response regulator YesN [Clostridium sp. USBA 49]